MTQSYTSGTSDIDDLLGPKRHKQQQVVEATPLTPNAPSISTTGVKAKMSSASIDLSNSKQVMAFLSNAAKSAVSKKRGGNAAQVAAEIMGATDQLMEIMEDSYPDDEASSFIMVKNTIHMLSPDKLKQFSRLLGVEISQFEDEADDLDVTGLRAELLSVIEDKPFTEIMAAMEMLKKSFIAKMEKLMARVVEDE
jgi:hypothetical protein